MQGISFNGALLKRGYWLYVWEVTTLKGRSVLYVGMTGDTGYNTAQSPFNRISAHLSTNARNNALARHLKHQGIVPRRSSFRLVAEQLYPATANMAEHTRRRNAVAAAEKRLRDGLLAGGYQVMNVVNCRTSLHPRLWNRVHAQFIGPFPNLK